MLLHREKEGRNTLRPSQLLLYFAFLLISLPFSPSSSQQENDQFDNTDLLSQNGHDPVRFPQSASLSPFLLFCHYRNSRQVPLPGAEIPTSSRCQTIPAPIICAIIPDIKNVPKITSNDTRRPFQPIVRNAFQSLPRSTPAKARIGVMEAIRSIFPVQ